MHVDVCACMCVCTLRKERARGSRHVPMRMLETLDSAYGIEEQCIRYSVLPLEDLVSMLQTLYTESDNQMLR